MKLLRVVLAWLLMAALPLQGLTAASMALCGEEHASRAQAVAHAQEAHGHDGHHHTADRHTADRHAADEASVHDAAEPAPDAASDADHKCSVCASCCIGIGIAELPHSEGFSPMPHATASLAPVPVLSPALRQPDKPPRA